MTQIPHLAVPLRLDVSGHFGTVEQGSTEEVVQCVAAIVSTPKGARLEIPLFGIVSPMFAVDNDHAGMLADIAEWEPRSDVLFERDQTSADRVRTIQIQVGAQRT